MPKIYYIKAQHNSSSPYNTSSSLLAFQSAERLQIILQPLEYFAGSYGLKPFKILLYPFLTEERKGWIYKIGFPVRKNISQAAIDDHIREILQHKNYTARCLLNYRKAIKDSIEEGNNTGKSWSEKLPINGLDILLQSAKQQGAKTSHEFIDSTASSEYFPLESEEGYQIRFIVEIDLGPIEKPFFKAASRLSVSMTNIKKQLRENYLKREIE